MQNKLLSIGQVAKLLNVSIDTLRRWDAAGRLPSVRSGPLGHRFYHQSDIDQFLQKVDTIARNWVEAALPEAPNPDMYCQTRDVFQARLEKLQSELARIAPIEVVSLITAVAGEIGNNSFDHNLGNWPNIPGIFFSYSLRDRKVVLADRGQGILATLKRVRPQLASSSEAMQVAFTETISGRYPETRGNGLKFVRSIIVKHPFSLYFQTGDAELYLKQGDNDLAIQQAKVSINGCFATISFEGLT
ncbi:MAG: MerR family DNA-binding transcriptional regulator [Candidatus Levybacteria bacterium]|nr:MerR family DNA-binding transcriptional regulator [Candidatus Levybacteria bacterium]